MRSMEGQLSLFGEQAEHMPGMCPMESAVVYMGRQLKSRCEEMGVWTNCRAVGHCTSDGRRHGYQDTDEEETDSAGAYGA